MAAGLIERTLLPSGAAPHEEAEDQFSDSDSDEVVSISDSDD